MKFWAVLFGLVFAVGNFSYALDPQSLSGSYEWQGELKKIAFHRWETGAWKTPEGVARKKALVKQGYVCYRKSPEEYTCHLKSSEGLLPENVKVFIADYLRSFVVQFSGPFLEPVEMINTSTEKDWWVEGTVIVNHSKIKGYKWTHQYNPHSDFIALPVSEEQPVPWFIFENSNLLRLPLQIEQKDGPKVRFLYQVEGMLEKI